MKTQTKVTDLAVVEKDLGPVISRALEIEIVGGEGLVEATELLSRLNKEFDKVEADRLNVTEGLTKSLREINGRYKKVKDKLTEPIDAIRAKMGAYQAKALKAQQEEEERIAGRIGPGKGKLSMETGIKRLEEVEKAEKTVEGENGSVVFVEVKKFEVVDILALPIEYHLANEPKIRLAMKDGRELPGVRYFVEQSVRNNR